MKPLCYAVTLLIFIILTASCDYDHDINQSGYGWAASLTDQQEAETNQPDTSEYEVVKTEDEWREILTSREYRILRGRGTELPFINDYYDNKKEGVYYCGACGQPVFTSDTKYKSGTGWPSFWEPITPSVVDEKEDNGLFMTRTETVCARCNSHLGHVFEDGPQPTGLRYCLNSQALDFVEMDLSSIDIDTLPVKERDKK